MATHELAAYRNKRRYAASGEPRGVQRRSKGSLKFVVQKHSSAHLHYDFRLEADGVLKSWAIPKGPSLDPSQQRLAIRVEDHPYDYRNFEGTIPEGHYGAGDVIVWDRGSYRQVPDGSEEAVLKGLRKGALSIELNGKRLRGLFSLVRLKPSRQWLLTKTRDAYASTRDITRISTSVRSGKRLRIRQR